MFKQILLVGALLLSSLPVESSEVTDKAYKAKQEAMELMYELCRT
jgi:hypothetical protein